MTQGLQTMSAHRDSRLEASVNESHGSTGKDMLLQQRRDAGKDGTDTPQQEWLEMQHPGSRIKGTFGNVQE